MKLIRSTDAPVFEAGGTSVTGYAAPSRGAAETSLWRLRLAPGSETPRHVLDREEVFLVSAGRMVAVTDAGEHVAGPGDCLIVPAGTAFSLRVPGAEPVRATACLAAGGQATVLPDGPTFAPPWAA